MKNKKKIVLLIATFVCLVLLCSAYLLHNNYQLGAQLYSSAGDMSVQCRLLADGIEDLENEFQKAGNDNEAVNRQSFDSAILSVHSSFGNENVPILKEVRSDLVQRFEELFQLSRDDETLKNTFTDKEKFAEIVVLRDRLNALADSLVDFQERYNQMSDWERYFTSWEKERESLSDTARIPES